MGPDQQDVETRVPNGNQNIVSISPQRLKRPFCNKFIKDLKKKHPSGDQNFVKETIASKNK